MNTAIGKRKIAIDDLPKYTVSEWEKWEGKWELIEGIPYAMSPMPTVKHQRVNGELYRQFAQLLDSCSNCEVFLPVNFKIDVHNILHPDLLIVCNRGDEKIYITTIPSLVVEIISKSSKKQNCLFLDYRTKSKDIDRTKIIERSEIFNSLISIYEKWLLNLDVNFIESPFSHVVTLDEAKENDYNFSFGRYFTFQNIDALDLENMTSLDEILTFNREGVSNNTESIVTKVSIKHLSKNPDDFYLDTIPLEVLDRKTRIPITSGNVLLVANVGQFIKPTFVQKQTEDIVFGLNNVDAYKVDLGQVNLEYLIQELNKDYVAEQASRFHIGVSMARLRKDDFLSIKINLPSLEEQEKLVKNEKQIRFQNLIRENGFEQELNRLKEQQRLDLGSKKHTLSQYVNSVKSSCSNLITVLNNNGGVLDGEYVINPQTGVTVRKRLDLLNDGIDKIIDQVENLTNEMVFDPKSILDARKMLKDCHTNGITSTRANFTFSYDEPTFDENSPLISVSETQFLELYNNIVDNAIRHGQFEEGKIEIKFLLSNEKGKVILEIKNNGKPFPEGISEKGVFTTKGEKAGETGHTGIGGWKIKEIVDYFGAKMEIIDEPKEEYPVGFKFLFNLEIDEV